MRFDIHHKIVAWKNGKMNIWKKSKLWLVWLGLGWVVFGWFNLSQSHQYLINVQFWNRRNHGLTIHSKQKFISYIANVLQDNIGLKKISLPAQKKWGSSLVLNIKNLGPLARVNHTITHNEYNQTKSMISVL